MEHALPAPVRAQLAALRDELANEEVTAKGYRKRRSKILAPYASESAFDDTGKGLKSRPGSGEWAHEGGWGQGARGSVKALGVRSRRSGFGQGARGSVKALGVRSRRTGFG